jgi:transposase
LATLLAAIVGRVIVAIDVAKEAMVAGFADAVGRVTALVRFSHPSETRLFLELLCAMRDANREVEVAMEPTGVYGDSLRYQLELRSFPVFRVDAKRCHDAAFLLDGVASQHDAKACTLIAHLHGHRISARWRGRSVVEMQARALVDEHVLSSDPLEKLQGRLEAMTAAHWPELNAAVDRRTSWYLHLLAEYPGPESVADNLGAALDLLRRKTRGRASHTGIAAVVTGAAETLGTPISNEQRELLQTTARRILAMRAQAEDVETRMRALCASNLALARVADAVGPAAAIAIFAFLGDPSQYSSAAALQKAAGLNLREKSSGKLQGPLHITKRGPKQVRHYLYLASLRLILESPIVRAWAEARRSFAPGTKRKALVAIMRKLIRAIFHVARGDRFDASKLFDVRRLDLPSVDAPRTSELLVA